MNRRLRRAMTSVQNRSGDTFTPNERAKIQTALSQLKEDEGLEVNRERDGSLAITVVKIPRSAAGGGGAYRLAGKLGRGWR